MVSKLTEGFDKKALMTEHAGTGFGIKDIVGKKIAPFTTWCSLITTAISGRPKR